MKINWKRVLIAGLWSELVAFVIYLAAFYAGPGPAWATIVILDWFSLMFLGGLWAARKIPSRFLLHGFLIAVVANIIYILISPIEFGMPQRATVWATVPTGGWKTLLIIAFAVGLKFLGCMLGAFVGGRRRNRLLSVQGSTVAP
jgi:hypothetical protein